MDKGAGRESRRIAPGTYASCACPPSCVCSTRELKPNDGRAKQVETAAVRDSALRVHAASVRDCGAVDDVPARSSRPPNREFNSTAAVIAGESTQGALAKRASSRIERGYAR